VKHLKSISSRQVVISNIKIRNVVAHVLPGSTEESRMFLEGPLYKKNTIIPQVIGRLAHKKISWQPWMNSATHETTKETPHFLLFGRDPFYPMISAGDEEKSTFELKNHIIQQMKLAAEKVMAYKPTINMPAQFKFGDAVLLKAPFAHQSDNTISKKLQPRWSQPFRVTDSLSSTRFNVANSSSVIKNVHADHMKHFINRIPQPILRGWDVE
jgi:hypothetical protein